MNAALSTEEVLALIPQQRPFRFVDRLIAIDETHAIGEYRFREDESFYAGHFPSDPVTPGVILLEAMCQTGLVALGIYLLALEAPRDEVAKTMTLFTEAQVEFERVVRPGTLVRIEAERRVWRRRKLKSYVVLSTISNESRAEVVAYGTVAGLGVTRDRA